MDCMPGMDSACFDVLMQEFGIAGSDEVLLHRHPERIEAQCSIIATRRICKDTCSAESLPTVCLPELVSKVSLNVVEDQCQGREKLDVGCEDVEECAAACMGRGRGRAHGNKFKGPRKIDLLFQTTCGN